MPVVIRNVGGPEGHRRYRRRLRAARAAMVEGRQIINRYDLKDYRSAHLDLLSQVRKLLAQIEEDTTTREEQEQEQEVLDRKARQLNSQRGRFKI